jgi:NAD+ kinase
MLLTPICPHSLYARELVLGADSVINIQITEERQDIFVSQDGQIGRNLRAGESLVIKKTPFDTVLYKNPGTTFFSHLREKFSWGA